MTDADQTQGVELALDPAKHNSTEGDLPPMPEEPIKNRAYILKPGFAYNPWLKWPRNLACVCGSGDKFKHCHDGKLSHAISILELDKAQKEMANALKVIGDLKAHGIFYRRPTEPTKEAKDEPTRQLEKPNDVPALPSDMVTT